MTRPDTVLSARTGITLTRDHVVAVPLSESEWKVTDDRLPDDDGRSVVGFIGRRSDVYEVVELGDPVRFSVFTSVEAALGHLAAAARRARGARITELRSVTRVFPRAV